MSYLNLIKKALKPNGFFAITCFVQGGELGGAEISDWEVYRLRSLKGGLGYTEDKLRSIFKDFNVIEIRNMIETTQRNFRCIWSIDCFISKKRRSISIVD